MNRFDRPQVDGAPVGLTTVEEAREDELLALLAHELRNPLAALANGVQLLDRLAPRDESERHARDVCGRQVQNLVRIVDDLLDASRLTCGRAPLRRERTDLATVVRAAVETTRVLTDRRGHEVRVDVGDGPLAIDADVTRLEQVFAGLLANAAQYTDAPSRIDVRVVREDGWARVEVVDAGRGLAPAMIEPVFELFTQVDRDLARTDGGLGLGLTVARTLVELHGGTITAASAGLGRGTTMTVRLPLAAVIVAPPVAVAPRRWRIVVVEDNDDARDMLCQLLEDRGHDVTSADDGVAGRDLIIATGPDLALVDIGLPGLDGYQIAREVRDLPAMAMTRLVALTGYGDVKSRERSRLAGFDAHLAKPFAMADLDALVDPAAQRHA